MPGEPALATGKTGQARMANATRTMRDLIGHRPADILRPDGIFGPFSSQRRTRRAANVTPHRAPADWDIISYCRETGYRWVVVRLITWCRTNL
jgi:hypothetical protein